MKLETMESFFNKGRTSHERFPIVISTPCDGNEVVCEFTAELNGLNVFRKSEESTATCSERLTHTFSEVRLDSLMWFYCRQWKNANPNHRDAHFHGAHAKRISGLISTKVVNLSS